MITKTGKGRKCRVETLFPFMESIILQFKEQGKERRSETYTTTLNSFKRFRKGKDLPLRNINKNEICTYESFLKQEGLCMNTISFYMRNLRAVYNRAVDAHLTSQKNPFKQVYTGLEKTRKRALSLPQIKRIKSQPFSDEPSLEFTRDLFMLSFYLRGMSFVDMAYLEKSNLKNGILTYRRKKTGQQLVIKWEPCMQQILDKYLLPQSPYLLPIIRSVRKDVRKEYLNASHLTNRKLKEIGELLNLPIPLTMYVARHSWASIAKEKNIPIAIISEGLGHDSEKTTQIYLSSLDTTKVDSANSLILHSLQV